jgi:hypothetical protein
MVSTTLFAALRFQLQVLGLVQVLKVVGSQAMVAEYAVLFGKFCGELKKSEEPS